MDSYCSFCGKRKGEVARLIDCPVMLAAICNECVDLLYGMLHDPPRQGPTILEKREAAKKALNWTGEELAAFDTTKPAIVTKAERGHKHGQE